MPPSIEPCEMTDKRLINQALAVLKRSGALVAELYFQ